jgi:hypothetical protein
VTEENRKINIEQELACAVAAAGAADRRSELLIGSG